MFKVKNLMLWSKMKILASRMNDLLKISNFDQKLKILFHIRNIHRNGLEVKLSEYKISDLFDSFRKNHRDKIIIS